MKNILTVLNYLFTSVLFSLVAVHSASADLVCYKTSSLKKGNKNVLQLFKGNSCPKGYTAVPKDLLTASTVGSSALGPSGEVGPKGDVGPVGLKGEQGEPGATGAKGDQGPQGAKGVVGVIGDQGKKGATGTQGPRGPQGDVGPQGETGGQGDKGNSGTSAQEYFRFSGTTASISAVADRTNVFPVSGSAKGSLSTYADIHKVSIPIGGVCGKLAYAVTVSNAPGAGNSYRALLSAVKGIDKGPVQSLPLCIIENSSTECTGSIDVAADFLTPDSSVSFELVSSGASSTTAKWSVRCISLTGTCASNDPSCTPLYRQNGENQRRFAESFIGEGAYGGGLATGCYYHCRNVSETCLGCYFGNLIRREFIQSRYERTLAKPTSSCEELAAADQVYCATQLRNDQNCYTACADFGIGCANACQEIATCESTMALAADYCPRSRCIDEGGSLETCPTKLHDCKKYVSYLPAFADASVAACLQDRCAALNEPQKSACIQGCNGGGTVAKSLTVDVFEAFCLNDAAGTCEDIRNAQSGYSCGGGFFGFYQCSDICNPLNNPDYRVCADACAAALNCYGAADEMYRVCTAAQNPN